MKRFGRFVLALAALAFLTVPAFAIEASSWLSYQIRQEETLDLYGNKFTSICVFAYDFDESDNLRPAQPWVDQTLDNLMAVPHPGRPVFITIVNDIESNPPQQHNGALIQRIISDPAKRAAHIQQLVQLAQRADGIDIDYEGLLAESHPLYPTFIAELKAALPPGKLLSVVAQPKTDNSVGPRGNAIDWAAVAPNVDILKVMTYYYSFGSSAPGPSAPLDKVRDVTRLAVTQIPASKLHVVLTHFGWDWPQGGTGKFLHYGTAIALAQQQGATVFRDPDSQVLRFDYTQGGVPHQVWFDDDVSLRARVAIIQGEGVNKIDFWQLGVGDPAFWNWVKDNTTNPDPGNPVPSLAVLDPGSVTVGAGPTVVTLTGSNFLINSRARWNGSDRPTMFIDNNTLEVTLPATDLDAPETGTITVFNAGPGGGTSGGLPFEVQSENQVPTITVLNPDRVSAGSPNFTMTVTGSHFAPGAVVRWNGVDRTTQFVNANRVIATIPASDVTLPTIAFVTVFNPAPGGGLSNALPFNVTLTNPLPNLDRLNPSRIPSEGPDFVLRAIGSNFSPTSVIRWNGADRATTFVSGTELSAVIPAADIAAMGTAEIRVFTPAPGGGLSQPQTLTISPPAPFIQSVQPDRIAVGTPAFILEITGNHFASGDTVRWNGQVRPTTFVNSSRLQANISAGDTIAAGTAAVTVTNALNDVSNRIVFTVLTVAQANALNGLDGVRAYPNPWVGNKHQGAPITFDLLSPGSTVRIFTMSSRWVRSLESNNGTALWDLRNDDGEKVASGYYIFLVTDEAGRKKQGKVAIIK